MNGYLAEVRNTHRAWRYAKAKNDAREYVESYAFYAVRIATERFEKQSGGSFCDLTLPFRQKLGEALAAILSGEVYPLATDQILQTREPIEAVLERAAFGAFDEAIERTPAGFKHLDPSLANVICPRRSNLSVGTRPMKSRKFTRPALRRTMTRARKFVDRHVAEALCIAIELFEEQPEGSFHDLPPLFHQKLEERLSRGLFT